MYPLGLAASAFEDLHFALWSFCFRSDSVAPLSPPLKMTRASLGRAARTLRLEAGLSQEKVALRGGIHPTHVSRLEQGKVNATQKTIARLAAGLGVSPSRIFSLAEAYEEMSSA
jgi:DNA-binding XRE family transcriptional regulator